MAVSKFWARYFRVSSLISLLSGNPVDALVDNELAQRNEREVQNNQSSQTKPDILAANPPTDALPETKIVSYDWPLLIAIGILSAPTAFGVSFAAITGLTLSLGAAFFVSLIFLIPVATLVMAYLSVTMMGKILAKQNVSFTNTIAFTTLSSVGFVLSFLSQQTQVGYIAYASIFCGGVFMPVYILLIDRAKRSSYMATALTVLGIILAICSVYFWNLFGIRSLFN